MTVALGLTRGGFCQHPLLRRMVAISPSGQLVFSALSRCPK